MNKTLTSLKIAITVVALIIFVKPVFSDELKGTDNTLAQEMLKNTWGQERSTAFANAMKDVSIEDQKKFWNLYKDYAAEQASLDERRFKLMDQYMTNYLLITEPQADDLMSRWIDLQKEELNGRIKMYKKLSNKVSALVGIRFYQMDDYLYNAMKVKYMSQYPIFGKRPDQSMIQQPTADK